MKTTIYASMIALGLSLPFVSTTQAAEPRDAAPSSANAAGGPTNRNAANTPNDTKDGIVIRDGVTYLVRNGEATPLDTAAVPEGFMRTWDGQVVPIPEGTTGFSSPTSGARGDSRPADKSTDAQQASGSATTTPDQNAKPDANAGNSGSGSGPKR